MSGAFGEWMWKGLGHRLAASHNVRMWAVVRPDGSLYATLDTQAAAHIFKPQGYYVLPCTVTLDPTETESVNNNAPSASGVEDEAASA